MVWELVFMLVLLKIPLVYLCFVVWWAIRAEPRDEQPAVAVHVTDTPPPHADWSRARRPGRDAGGRRGGRRSAAIRRARTPREVAR